MRNTYRVKLEFLCQLDDESLIEVKRMVQEHINMMFHTMEHDDIRITLQTDFGVMDIDEPRLEHQWEFYMNGSFCKRCGAAIGSGVPCR